MTGRSLKPLSLVCLIAASAGCYAAGTYDPALPVPAPAPRATVPAPEAAEPVSATANAVPAADDPAPRRRDDESFGPEKGDWELLLGGSGTNDNNFDTGSLSFTGSLGYFLTENLELSVRQNLNWADSGDSTYIAATRGALDVHFDLDHVYPFVGLNLGYVYGDQVDETLEAAPEVGVKWFVKRDTFIYGLIEYQFFFNDTDSVDDGFDRGAFVYSLGIGFTF